MCKINCSGGCIDCAPEDHLFAACEEITQDYMTSEEHHPDYVLIPKKWFEVIQQVVQIMGEDA